MPPGASAAGHWTTRGSGKAWHQVPGARRPDSGRAVVNPRGRGGSMPTPVIRARAALALPWALLCACLLMLTAAPLAEASAPAGIRVVAPDGQTLAEATQLTGPARLKTSPKADCLGPGPCGLADRATAPAASGLLHC